MYAAMVGAALYTQGRDDDELPEQLLASINFAGLEMEPKRAIDFESFHDK